MSLSKPMYTFVLFYKIKQYWINHKLNMKTKYAIFLIIQDAVKVRN